MVNRRLSLNAITGLAFLVTAIFLSQTGCQTGTPTEIMVGPDRSQPEQIDVHMLKRRVLNNSTKLKSLRADVEMAMVSPLLRQPPQLSLSGRLAVKKFTDGRENKAAVRIHLSHRNGDITFIGNGEYYQVDMPLLNMSYEGHYDDVLEPRENRIHFTPAEIANVFNLEGLLLHRPQTLKAYPAHWAHSAIGEDRPPEFPPQWVLDTIKIEDGDDPFPWIHNSIVIDSRNENLMRIDTFRPQGTLLTRTWLLDERVIRTPDRETVRIPSEIMIWYPPPLEGTVIRLRLSNFTINEELDEALFDF